MKSTAAGWPMIRLMLTLATGAAVMLLLVSWQDDKLPLATSLSPVSADNTPERTRDSKRAEQDGYRIIDGDGSSAEPATAGHVALRFKETEAKQGLGSAADQRPRPTLGGSNRGKSLKQS